MRYPRSVLALAHCMCLVVTEVKANDAASVGSGAAAESAAPVDAKQEAEKHFRAGVSLQKAEDFEAATVAFQASLRLYPTKAALFNLANCLRATHRYADALNAFEKLKRDFGNQLEDPMLAAVNMQVVELENLTGSLALEIEPKGSEVKVDGRAIGSAPLPEAVRLALGDHELEISRPGFETEVLRVNVAPGQEASRRITLKPLAPPSPTTPAAQSPPETPVLTAAPEATSSPTQRDHDQKGGQYRTAALVSGGSGLAFLAAGTASGLWALSINRDLDRACEGSHCPASRGEDIDRLQTLTHVTNVLLTIGAVATVSGVVLWLVGDAPSPNATLGTDAQLELAPGVAKAKFVQRF